jgi:hypothetical protein
VKLHVEIEVDTEDLDAVTFALARCGRPEAVIVYRMEIVGREIIENAHEMLNTWRQYVAQAREAVQPEAARSEDRRKGGGSVARA